MGTIAGSRATEALLTPTHLRLREIRERQGLTQVELAEITGISQSAISRLETGEIHQVNLDVLDRLARALQVKPGAFFKQEGN